MADLPTIAESGFPGFDLTSWNGIFAPAATPPATIARLEAAAHHAIADATVRERLTASGNDPIAGTSAAFAELIRRDGAMVRQLVADTGMRLD
jgi:tripartite-type tricarboxylate transporter receptor subunit TctC